MQVNKAKAAVPSKKKIKGNKYSKRREKGHREEHWTKANA